MPSFEKMGMLYGKSGGILLQGISLQEDLYMTQTDQVFVVDVLIIDLAQGMVVSNVIN
jgi:hypothetical protein